MENHQGGPPINAPEELSPFHRHGGPSEMGPGYSPDVRESEGYRACELPRLQFFSDIWDVARGLVGEARGAEVQKEREREQDKAKDRERERDWTAVSPVFSAASDDDSILPRIVGLDSLCDQWLPPAALNE